MNQISIASDVVSSTFECIFFQQITPFRGSRQHLARVSKTIVESKEFLRSKFLVEPQVMQQLQVGLLWWSKHKGDNLTCIQDGVANPPGTSNILVYLIVLMTNVLDSLRALGNTFSGNFGKYL